MAKMDIAANPAKSMTSLAVLWLGIASSLGITSMNATYKNVPAMQKKSNEISLPQRLTYKHAEDKETTVRKLMHRSQACLVIDQFHVCQGDDKRRRSSSPDAKADTDAAASLFDTLDSTTPSKMPTGVADAKKPITVQNFRMLACRCHRQCQN